MGIKLTIDESVFDYKKGKKIVTEVNGKTIGECLNYIIKRRPTLKKAIFDENGNLCLGILIKVNGSFVYSNHLITSVKDGDAVEVMKFTGG